MLTNEYLKDHFIDAYFIDEDRQNIEILQTAEDKKSVFSSIIPFDEEHPEFQALKSVVTVDGLHERTYNKKKEERKLFEEQLLRIAKKDGMVIDETKDKTTIFPTLIQTIIEDEKNEDHLFALKLALFEVDKIRDSENNELKSNIRKGKSKPEVILNAMKIILE